jgi:hypothetical protein
LSAQKDRLIRLPEVCKILGISLREAQYEMQAGDFLAPRISKPSLRGEPTKYWSERRVRAWAGSWVRELLAAELLDRHEAEVPAHVTRIVDRQEREEAAQRIAAEKSRWWKAPLDTTQE